MFNPSSYSGYDPTGAKESSAAFQSAIDAASRWATDHAASPEQYGLFVPRLLKTAAGKASPCSLAKKARYAAIPFPDGKLLTGLGNTSLERRFTADRDPRRYPNADRAIGNTPRGGAIKARQVRDFLVEKMFYLAHAGEVLTPQDDPPGPTAIGSNTYPATAGNGFSTGGINGTDDFREEAVQPRNGTIRHLHCENCTRGYGILELHSGVDLEYRYISTRGGIAIRWESAANGRSTRQTAQQVVAVDCNTAVLMSTHENNTSGLGVPGPEQDTLKASFIKAVGCDNGIRSATMGGTNVGSSFSDVWIVPGARAQVIRCRGGGGSGPATLDGCSKYGVASYDDDAWTYERSQIAINNPLSIPLSRVHCVESAFAKPNVNGRCAAFP